MGSRRIALIAASITILLLISGCHRLGLVKSAASTPKTRSSAVASSTIPPAGQPATATVTIAVQNGGGVNGRGAAMVAKLDQLGYRPGKATNAKTTNHATTVIFYSPGHAAEAAQVQKALGFGKTQPASAGVTLSTSVLVIVGKDY